MRTLSDGIGHETIEAYPHEQQREHAEKTRKSREEPLLEERFPILFLLSPHIGNRNVPIHLLNDIANFGDKAQRIDVGANLNVHSAKITRPLQGRQVEIGQLLLTCAPVLCILNHAHNRDSRWQVSVSKPPAEWICVPEELASHRLAYQDDSLSG